MTKTILQITSNDGTPYQPEEGQQRYMPMWEKEALWHI